MTGDPLYALILGTLLNCFLITYCMLKEDQAFKNIYKLGISVQQSKERYICYVLIAIISLTTIAYNGYIVLCSVLIFYLLTLRLFALIGKKKLYKTNK